MKARAWLAAVGVPWALLAWTGCGREHTTATPTPATTTRAPESPGTSALPLHFTDMTRDSGLEMLITSGRSPSTQILEVKGGGLALIDYDNDGDLDVFVPNGATLDAFDHGPGCRLFENLGGLKFKDVTREAGLDFKGWGMGVAVGDVDGDGYDDIYIACYGADVFLHNTGHKSFVDATKASGLGNPRWSTGCAFGDLDGDGDLDLYVVNYLEFDIAHPPPPDRFLGVPVFSGPTGLAPVADILYENTGDGRFRDISQSSGIAAAKPSFGLGVAILDFDGDGDIDIVVGELNGPVRILRNDSKGGHWLIVELADARPGAKNRRGLGAKVELKCGAESQTRWLFTGGSFQSSSAPYVHFGLREKAPCELDILWPDGTHQHASDVAPDQRQIVRHE